MSKIEWTDETWNPIAGCNDVSEGCRHCYARTMAKRLEAMGTTKYAGLTVLQGSKRVWTGKIAFDEAALLQPLKRKKPTRYFVNSMSDLFHPNVTDEMRDKIFAVMALCPQHTFQVLTKRPERMLAYLNALDVDGVDMAGSDGAYRWATEAGGFFTQGRRLDRLIAEFICDAHEDTCLFDDTDPDGEVTDEFYCLKPIPWPLPNVQLGVSVEDQPTADERIPLLLQTPATVRFVSAEPLLGSVDFGYMPQANSPQGWTWVHTLNGWNSGHRNGCGPGQQGARLDWIICGGESGPGARPMHPEWARSLRDQCVTAGVPFFFKQWGKWVSVSEVEGNGKHFSFPDGATVRRVGKKVAGRLLEGREWNEMPGTVVTA